LVERVIAVRSLTSRAIMRLFLLMDRRAVERLLQWKVQLMMKTWSL